MTIVVPERFVLPVHLSRSFPPYKMIRATMRERLDVDDKVVSTMPRGKGEYIEIVFLRLGEDMDDNQAIQRCVGQGLVPVDPYSLLAVNTDFPNLTVYNHNFTLWKDNQGRWCSCYFDDAGSRRLVSVCPSSDFWEDDWYIAGKVYNRSAS